MALRSRPFPFLALRPRRRSVASELPPPRAISQPAAAGPSHRHGTGTASPCRPIPGSEPAACYAHSIAHCDRPPRRAAGAVQGLPVRARVHAGARRAPRAAWDTTRSVASHRAIAHAAPRASTDRQIDPRGGRTAWRPQRGAAQVECNIFGARRHRLPLVRPRCVRASCGCPGRVSTRSTVLCSSPRRIESR